MSGNWRKTESLEDRFNQYVVRNESGCWDWIGAGGSTGYGSVTYKTKRISAHRISYELYKGKIQKGLFVCHTCDNRKCTNPDHLFLGTIQENLKDMRDKKRHNLGSKNARSKLTEEEVVSLRKMNRVRYFEQQELSKHFDITRSAVSFILNNKSWKHI